MSLQRLLAPCPPLRCPWTGRRQLQSRNMPRTCTLSSGLRGLALPIRVSYDVCSHNGLSITHQIFCTCLSFLFYRWKLQLRCASTTTCELTLVDLMQRQGLHQKPRILRTYAIAAPMSTQFTKIPGFTQIGEPVDLTLSESFFQLDSCVCVQLL